MFRKKINLLFLAVSIAIGSAIFVFNTDPSLFFASFRLGDKEYHTVEFRKDGFHPEEITIRKGEKIKFTTTLDRRFWPASSRHPTHTIYSEFDPKESIEPNESWSFLFKEAGSWEYHDHLTPYFTGTVRVIYEGEPHTKEDACQGSQDSVECWEEKLFLALDTNGVDAAFELMADLYVSEARFPMHCHGIAHDIGIRAYGQFLKNKDSILTQKAAYCANGFYHGFMEALLTVTRDPEEAREFCAYVDEKLSSKTPDASLQCYHGIGHGAIDITIASYESGQDERFLVKQALQFCEEVSDTSQQLYRCASGTFNGIANFYISGEFNLSVNEEDPLWLCNEQPERYRYSCYGNMNSALWWIGRGDFGKSAKFIENIPEDKYAISAIQYLSRLAVLEIAERSHEEAIMACRALQERLYLPCINGFVNGYLEHGIPEAEHKQAFGFCRSVVMTQEERESCFKHTLSVLGGWYDIEKVRQICRSVEAKYQQYCIIYKD